MKPFAWLRGLVEGHHPEAEYDAFWARHSDRVAMSTVVYPAAREHLARRGSRRVLEVGARWFTRRSRRLIDLPGLHYAVVDPACKPVGLEADAYHRMRLEALPRRRPSLRGSFDLILSFGVLGFYPMRREQAAQYLAAASELLCSDGVFVLKIDLTRMAARPAHLRVSSDDVEPFFQPAMLGTLPARMYAEDESQRYEFSVWRRRAGVT